MKGHTRFVAVAGLPPSGKAVDANLRKLQIDFWVVCVNVRACTRVHPSVLMAMSRSVPREKCKSSTYDGPGFPDFPFLASRGVEQLTQNTAPDASFQFVRDFSPCLSTRVL